MKKKYLIFLCGIGAIWLCNAAARTVDNKKTPVVTFADIQKGRIEYFCEAESRLEAAVTYRVRCPASLIIEDVYIKDGDMVKKGDPVLTVYGKSLEKAISMCVDEVQLDLLEDIRYNSYKWIAEQDMYITDVHIEEDCSITEDTLIFKYAPVDCTEYTAQFEIDEITASKFNVGDSLKYTYTYNENNGERVYIGECEIIHKENAAVICHFVDQEEPHHGENIKVNFSHQTEIFDYVVSNSVLHYSDHLGKYRIYYALPTEEYGRYIVVESDVKILESGAEESAIEFPYTDGRKIISHAEGNIYHGCTVRT